MNSNRRKFLKVVLIGGASFIVGKVLGSLLSKFMDGSSVKNDSIASSFKFVEDKKSLYVYDISGEEVLQIDKAA